MKRISLILASALLTVTALSAQAADRRDRSWDGHRSSQHQDRYDRRGPDRYYDQDRYRHGGRSDYRRPPVVIYRNNPYYQNYGYRPAVRYDYYGNRYVHHRGRYYDQCSSSDRNAAALAGAVLGGAIGSQANQRDPQVGAIVGATIGGLIANEVAGGRCR